MAKFSDSTHWRDSARSARFFIVDARAAFPLLLFLLHMRLWTFTIAIIAMAFFGLLERYGFSLVVFGRWLRNVMAGPVKSCQPWWKN